MHLNLPGALVYLFEIFVAEDLLNLFLFFLDDAIVMVLQCIEVLVEAKMEGSGYVILQVLE